MQHSKILSLAVAVAAMLSGAGVSWAQTQPTGTWSTTTPSGATILNGWQYTDSNALVSDGTYVYCIGGYSYYYPDNASYPNYYAATRRYDPVNNSWTTLAVMPTGCYSNTGAYYNGFIYSFGNGWNGNGAIYRYQISNNQWTPLSVSLRDNRFQAACATLGSKIYIFGGYQYVTYNASNLCDEFDPSNNSITARANMPAGSYYPGAAAVPNLNLIYVVGGINGSYLSTCYEYSPTDNTWATRAPISNGSAAQPRYGPGAFSFSNRLYVIGGYNNQNMTTTLEYNPASNAWVQRANIQYGRYYFGGVAVGTSGYIYGGYGNGYQYMERYAPPSFGSTPNAPTDIMQSGSQTASTLQALDDSNQVNGWTNSQVTFSATVTDPDAGQQVRLRVQVKPENVSSWTSTQVVPLQTPLGAQGLKTLNWTIPAGGGYDWRWRVEDAFANSYPVPGTAWVEAFGTLAAPNIESPDFRSDQVSPTDPVGLEPSDDDIQVPDPATGPVTLSWIESTDNGPVSGISYELQVARDGGFIDIEAQIFSSAGTSQYPITLSVSRFDKFWRIRARDVGGNFSPWSAPLSFRVTHDDQINHSAGDAQKNCGMAAFGAPAFGSALLGLAIVGLAAGRRMFRRV